ncbi:MAG: hypothetical protein K0Q75_135 [Anaerospora sp.]|nr:hypothetical protein [Anaerospora sp.]
MNSIDPQHYNYLLFSSLAYKNINTDFSFAGYNVIDYPVSKNDQSGFNATVLKNDDNKEIVIAIRGTQIHDLHDIVNDLALLTGEVPSQLLDLMKVYETVRAKNPEYKIVFVGHSLGGLLAQLGAATAITGKVTNSKTSDTNVSAITFNAPGAKQLAEDSFYPANDDSGQPVRKYVPFDPNRDYDFINYGKETDAVSKVGVHLGKFVEISGSEPSISPLNIVPSALQWILGEHSIDDLVDENIGTVTPQESIFDNILNFDAAKNYFTDYFRDRSPDTITLQMGSDFFKTELMTGD